MIRIHARRTAMIAAASAAFALGACSGGGSDTPTDNAIETNVVMDDVVMNDADVNLSAPEAPPVAEPSAAPARRPAAFGNMEETMDDADAVGMTSRVDRSAGTEEPAH